jgi:hypothetical protein
MGVEMIEGFVEEKVGRRVPALMLEKEQLLSSLHAHEVLNQLLEGDPRPNRSLCES